MMKKVIAGGLCAAMIMTSASGVAAAEMTEAYTLNYGFSMIADGESMQEDITIVTNGESATGSMTVVADGITVELPEYMLATPDGTYVNAEGILDLVKTMGTEGMEGIDGIVSLLGITEKWVKLAPIDLGAIEFPENPFDVEIPEFDEEMEAELSELLMNLVKFEATEDGEIAYVIDNETVDATAEAIDEFKENHLQFVGDILEYAQDVIAGSIQVDVKPAIRNYLDAVAEGYAAADSSVSVEDAKTEIDAMFDVYAEEGVAALAEEIQAVPVADFWNEFSVKDIVDNVIADTPFEIKVIMSEEDIACEMTVDGETIHGTIEETDGTIILTIYDVDDTLAGTVEVIQSDNGAESMVKDADGNVVTDCKVEWTETEEGIQATYDLIVAEGYDIADAESGFEFHGYLTQTAWEDDGSLETPENSNDILDIIKNVSTLFFTSMIYSE